jgi:hypothetical protein
VFLKTTAGREVLTAQQATGLVHHLMSIKAAAESGFEQHLTEVKQSTNS